ncbi:single-stranded-DNA-specific exonuclease RecJ [Candidatus Jidaibacter acanthamoebae]|nr:single-stranded-DNA-specific exonuclease RecJ [Candidatus Jidaibacter acanthamoeba]
MLAESNNAEGIKFGRSIRGLDWKFEEGCERTIRTLCQKLNINEVLARILYNRDVKTAEEAENFLDPKLKNLIHNPFALKDMDKASKRIIDAINNKEKICVFGDYDVDGATSSALLKRFFRDLNIEIGVYIPNRLKEGYGPNKLAFDKLKEEGYSLVITVDCGIVSFEPLKHAKDIGLEVIIVDHHLGIEQLPEAIAVINPNRFDEDFPYKYMAAVGVAFMVTVALRAKLREEDWFVKNNIKEPDLLKLLDLVALGTVCDVMILKGVNRAFVTQGLKIIAKRGNVGIATLANLVKLDSEPKAHHLGYVFGPRINAGGRVGEGILGTYLLSTECPKEAYNIAMQLEKYNEERRSIEIKALEEAIEQIEKNRLYNNSIMLVQSKDWHIGILGILASKLKEKYSRPAGVMVIKEDTAKGSARSITGLDLGRALASAKTEGLLLEGGGHAMAGGFTVEISKMQPFCDYLINKLDIGAEPFIKAKELHIDHVLSVASVNHKLIEDINIAAPYGSGNPAPKFALHDVIITRALIVGGYHVMVIVTDKKVDRGNKVQKCILFKGSETDLGQFLLNSIGKKINIAGTIQASSFDKNKIDFIIEDASVNE